jgi:hypothetical protein
VAGVLHVGEVDQELAFGMSVEAAVGNDEKAFGHMRLVIVARKPTGIIEEVQRAG